MYNNRLLSPEESAQVTQARWLPVMRSVQVPEWRQSGKTGLTGATLREKTFTRWENRQVGHLVATHSLHDSGRVRFRSLNFTPLSVTQVFYPSVPSSGLERVFSHGESDVNDLLSNTKYCLFLISQQKWNCKLFFSRHLMETKKANIT